MASTIPPVEAELWAKWQAKQSQFDATKTQTGSSTYGFGTRALDDVYKMLWMAAPWSWTLKSLAEQALVDGTQDYTFNDDEDLKALQLHKVTRYSSTQENELVIVPILPATSHKEPPQRVAIQSQVAPNITLRVHPLPGSTDTLVPIVKNAPANITDANKSSVLTGQFPDAFWPVFQQFVLWQALVYIAPERAGSAQTNSNGQRVYTGQLGVAWGFLQDYLKSQGLDLNPSNLPLQKAGRGTIGDS